MSTKPRTTKVSKIGHRGPEIFFWRLQDDVFFQRFEELNDAQIRFYLGLRKSWMGRGGTAVIVEERTPRMAELADAAKEVQCLVDEGYIMREDALAMAHRINAEARPDPRVKPSKRSSV
jgi:hypothetical protein